jgi:hypothetical protein
MHELDRLLKQIDPSENLEKLEKQIDKAMNTFKLNKASTENWEEFETCLANFLWHTDKVILKINPPVNPKMHYHRCLRFLNEEYGPKGEKIAFEMAKTGLDGGLYAVLKALAKRLARFYAQNKVRYLVDEFWNNLSFDDKAKAAKKYSEKYGRLIPAKLNERGSVLLIGFLPKILEQHPDRIQRMRRRVGR